MRVEASAACENRFATLTRRPLPALSGEWAGNCPPERGIMRVFVLDKNLRPLAPCTNYRARKLLDKGRARVYRRYPFTIVLIDREQGDVQELEFKVDPGSKTTGIAIVAHFKRGYVVIWGCNLKHRGEKIRENLEKRRAVRRNRRNRKTRYRKPRFKNRRRKQNRSLPRTSKQFVFR